MTRGCNLPEDFRMVGGVLADREKRCFETVAGECGQHRGCVARPGTVIEGEHDLTGLQEIVLLEVLESKARAPRGVDLYCAGDAQCVRVARTGDRLRSRGGAGRRGRSRLRRGGLLSGCSTSWLGCSSAWWRCWRSGRPSLSLGGTPETRCLA